MTSLSEEAEARRLDAEDPLRGFRSRFLVPRGEDGAELVYLCANSLGLMPSGGREALARELDDWAARAVEGHFHASTPWYSYHETLRAGLAGLVGARPDEVVAMNSLTVNLHLMLATFYRHTREKWRVALEAPAFPSDLYALQTQVEWRGLDPELGVVLVRPRAGEDLLRHEDIEAAVADPSLALILLSGVNYHTGQRLDLARLAAAARSRGVVLGADLAHAVGNVPLRLHDWGVDFAVWCSYKYLSGGPGAIGGCFVHARHGSDVSLPRLGGWWGADPARRFHMPAAGRFEPVPTADGWQLSNPPVFAMAPLRAALEVFEAAGMGALREKSVRLTGFLERLVDRIASPRLTIVTPRDRESRGCQLSLRVAERGRELFAELRDRGMVCDFREPDIIRVAPMPLYNTFHEVWRFARALGEADAQLAAGASPQAADAGRLGRA